MIGSETKTIGDSTYTVRQLTATPAVTLLTRLTKLIGPSFGALSAGENVGEKVSSAVNLLASRLDEAEVSDIIKKLIACVELETGGESSVALSKVFESHFHGGNLSELFQLLGFVLEVNYSDFFAGFASVKKKAAALLADAPQASKSPTTSGGQPGA